MAQEVPLITQYHPFKFQEDTNKICKYFDIGEGVEVPYSDSIKVISGVAIKKNSVWQINYGHIFPKVALTESCVVYCFAQNVSSVWLHLKHLKIAITT